MLKTMVINSVGALRVGIHFVYWCAFVSAVIAEVSVVSLPLQRPSSPLTPIYQTINSTRLLDEGTIGRLPLASLILSVLTITRICYDVYHSRRGMQGERNSSILIIAMV